MYYVKNIFSLIGYEILLGTLYLALEIRSY